MLGTVESEDESNKHQHNGNPNRYSTLSTPSSHTSTLTSAFLEIEDGLRRLDDARLARQRFVPSEQKSEMISKLALSAKLERALRWRMSGQDAVLRRKKAASVSTTLSAPVIDEKKAVAAA